jgi:hypothetical protein
MHARRTLLLFAIVLGLAALATSVAQSPRRQARPEAEPGAAQRSPTAARPAGSARVVMRIDRRGRARMRVLAAGAPATLLVEVPEPGEVELAGLGLTGAANPLTPARFELLPEQPGRHAVIFDPAGAAGPGRAGTLLVSAERR